MAKLNKKGKQKPPDQSKAPIADVVQAELPKEEPKSVPSRADFVSLEIPQDRGSLVENTLLTRDEVAQRRDEISRGREARHGALADFWTADQEAAAAGGGDDEWGAGGDGADDMWGADHQTDTGYDGGGDVTDWDDGGGDDADADGNWGVPQSVPSQRNPAGGGGGKKRGASAAPPPPPKTLHPPAAANDGGMGGWGNAPAASAQDWAVPENTWGQPPSTNTWGVPPSPTQAPPSAARSRGAWSNWADEAKNLPKSQAAQRPNAMAAQAADLQRALLQQQQMQYQQQQQFQQQQLQQMQNQRQQQQPSLNRKGRKNQTQHVQFEQPARAPPMQQADSWGSTVHNSTGGWGTDWASPIPEQEEEEEEEEYGEEEDDWGQPHRVRFTESPNLSYGYPSPAPAAPPPAPPPPLRSQHAIWTPSASKTMSTALGRTTVFELAAPRNGLSENSFVESHGEALEHAQRALFGPGRKAKERIRWGLTSEKDQRVASLLRWIHAMSNGLATVGLQKFLETGERGALVTNAGYRTNTAPGLPAQPAFDWVPISELQRTLDQRMQETVARYDPGAQSVVFVFLLSNSENSMAVWHRKLAVPDALRLARIAQIKEAKAKLTGDYAVYVDELPPKVEPEEPKKKRNFLSRPKWLKFSSTS